MMLKTSCLEEFDVEECTMRAPVSLHGFPQMSAGSLGYCYGLILPIRKSWKYSLPMVKGGEGNGTPLQYSCLENPMDRRAWWAAVHGVTEGQTRLSDFTFTFHFHSLEKEMATHWRIPGMAGPGGLPSMQSHRV